MNIFEKLYYKTQTLLSIFFNKRYSRKVRKQLKNDQFSILCTNCIGGVIYHRLGKAFLTPTINMWINQKEFLVFLENLEECLTADIEFVESKYDYPVAMIRCKDGDVILHFNHAETEEAAKADWYRRRTRVNFDNLYIIMYDRDGVTENDLLRLEAIPCKNKVVLSDRTYDRIPYVHKIKPRSVPFGEQYLDKDWLGFRTFEKHFDYVGFLNVM